MNERGVDDPFGALDKWIAGTRRISENQNDLEPITEKVLTVTIPCVAPMVKLRKEWMKRAEAIRWVHGRPGEWYHYMGGSMIKRIKPGRVYEIKTTRETAAEQRITEGIEDEVGNKDLFHPPLQWVAGTTRTHKATTHLKKALTKPLPALPRGGKRAWEQKNVGATHDKLH